MRHDEIDKARRHTRPLSTTEWVAVALRETSGDRREAMQWIHGIYGDNPTAEQLHAMAKILIFLAEEEL